MKICALTLEFFAAWTPFSVATAFDYGRSVALGINIRSKKNVPPSGDQSSPLGFSRNLVSRYPQSPSPSRHRNPQSIPAIRLLW